METHRSLSQIEARARHTQREACCRLERRGGRRGVRNTHCTGHKHGGVWLTCTRGVHNAGSRCQIRTLISRKFGLDSRSIGFARIVTEAGRRGAASIRQVRCPRMVPHMRAQPSNDACRAVVRPSGPLRRRPSSVRSEQDLQVRARSQPLPKINEVCGCPCRGRIASMDTTDMGSPGYL